MNETGAQLTEPTDPTPASTTPPEPPWSPAVSARALSLWLGLMALGGMMFGMYGVQRPFGDGLITHPLTIFCGLGLAGLLILRFAGDRPLVSDRLLIAGVVVGVACYFLGVWFGTAMLVIR